MIENKLREERLRWALRYILLHPDITPDILSKEWNIGEDEAIEICASNFSTAMTYHGVENSQITFEDCEKKIFKQLLTLEKEHEL